MAQTCRLKTEPLARLFGALWSHGLIFRVMFVSSCILWYLGQKTHDHVNTLLNRVTPVKKPVDSTQGSFPRSMVKKSTWGRGVCHLKKGQFPLDKCDIWQHFSLYNENEQIRKFSLRKHLLPGREEGFTEYFGIKNCGNCKKNLNEIPVKCIDLQNWECEMQQKSFGKNLCPKNTKLKNIKTWQNPRSRKMKNKIQWKEKYAPKKDKKAKKKAKKRKMDECKKRRTAYAFLSLEKTP